MTLVLFISTLISLQAQDCNCKDAFEATVQAYEENYALFIYKVTDQNQSLYDAHKELMRNKAGQVSTLSECKTVLDRYLHFFRDGHTYILNSSSSEEDLYFEKIPLSEKQFKDDYKAKNFTLNPILGIWESGSYTVAIIPNPEDNNRERDYVGIILDSGNPDWEQTDVKFELISDFGTDYQVNFMLGDHSIYQTTGQQVNNSLLELDGLNAWQKIWPEQTQKPVNEIDAKFKEFHLSYIEEIPYLRLPSFGSVGASFVDSTLQAHHENIMKSDFMIVDIRGNSGGSDYTYFPLLPYILSGPIEVPVSGYWYTDYNIQFWMDYITGEPNKKVEDYTPNEKEKFDVMMSNKGTPFFENPDYSYTYNADTLYMGPQKIIILQDYETASSGETLVFRAKQSDRVVVYGQSTAGVVDGFNGFGIEIGSFEAIFPTSFRAKDLKENPIDPHGIAPDVYVNEKVDVLEYAIEHMRQLLENEHGQKLQFATSQTD
ncbi:S41 family peptidase [Litoribacter populi]|uniref:S41 family peptidase n=1 Tax=Litoribacter populi TaxID=2598460 RepID=UPI001C8F60C8|nr:S41 family peptidase [Litoribacter populi]